MKLECSSLAPHRETPPHLPDQRTNIDDGAEERSYFGFILLYDVFVVEDRDNTVPIMLKIDDNNLSKSDDFGRERLYLNANIRVVSTVYPRDKTVTQLLHNKPITNGLTGNLAIAEIDLTNFAPSSCKDCNALLTKREDVIRRFYETMAPSLGHH